ncbi:hypothetical protein [Bacillus sp. P14.5]|uniref:hypothetical protein n=1 Tax=Bacillus sp. P14.5 TaxID=1983400 RepID=UPI000DE91144|nr:hypothetical protein [Bacillus sp. P14.5]
MKQYIGKILAVVLLLMGLLPWMAAETAAQGTLTIDTEPGINGKVKSGSAFPVTVTITNEGEDISGDLVVSTSPHYHAYGNVVIPVEIAGGTEQKIQFSVPGFNDYMGGPMNPTGKKEKRIRFYEGGWEEDKQIKLSGDTNLTPSLVPEMKPVLGVLSDNPDQMNVLKMTSYQGEAPEVLPLDPETMPEDSLGLNMFDAVIIHDYSIDKLSEQKQAALKQWVELGGRLIIGSSPDLQQKMGALDSLIPMNVSGEEKLKDLSFLQGFSDKPLPMEEMTVMTGDIEAGADRVIEEGGKVLAVEKGFGTGEVTQLTYSLAEEPLASWEGNSGWWNRILTATLDTSFKHPMTFYDQAENILRTTTELFASSFLPVSVITLLFALYIIIIVPVLYFILKKKDKREWGWWIIPSIAVLTSLGIFLTGAADRTGGENLNKVAIVSVNEEGMGSGFHFASMLSSGGGDYTMEFGSESLNPVPFNQSYVEETNFSDYPMIQNSGEGSKVTFQDVEFWSVRSTMNQFTSLETGRIEGDLKAGNEFLSGTVTNTMKHDLHDVFVLAGGSAYKIGSLAKGEEKKIEVEMKSSTLLSSPNSIAAGRAFPGAQNIMYGPGPGPQTKPGDDWKMFNLLNYALEEKIYNYSLKKPLIIGYSDESLIEMTVNGNSAEEESLNLFLQPFDIESNNTGSFKLKQEQMEPHVSVVEGMIHHQDFMEGNYYIDAAPGTYDLSFQLPDSVIDKKVTYSKMVLSFRDIETTDGLSLVNAKTGETEELESGVRQIKIDEDVQRYIDKDGKLTIRIEKRGQNNPQLPVPGVTIEGEFVQ